MSILGGLLQKKFNDDNNSIAYTKIIPDTKLKAVKIVTKTDATKAELLSLLNTNLIERQKEWNKTFTMGYIVDYVSSSLQVHYWLYKVPPLEPRDFVVVRRKKKMSNGAVAIIEKSIDHGRAVPTKNAIRCNIIYQIRYIEPFDMNNENSGCKFIVVNLTDIKGWIPAAVTNSSNVDISYEESMHMFTAAKSNRGDNDTNYDTN